MEVKADRIVNKDARIYLNTEMKPNYLIQDVQKLTKSNDEIIILHGSLGEI